jgi:NAD-dependent deacetylase
MKCTDQPHDIPEGLLNKLRQIRRLVVFTGAGMSAESGIPTFRDPVYGLWEQFNPHDLASAEGWEEDRERVWAWYEWRRSVAIRVQPHAGHLALASLPQILSAISGHDIVVDIVTQNVDDLHERAGSVNVQHLHGSLFAPRCDRCAISGVFAEPPLQAAIPKLPPPKCQQCSGVMRPGVVWFGEDLPQDVWRRAEQMMMAADMVLVVGTSGVVYPAASLPLRALENKTWVVEINPNETVLSNKVNLHWKISAAEGLSTLCAFLNAKP